MIEQILMGASAVITLSTAYVAWNRAKALEAMVERHNRMRRYAHKAWHRNVDLRIEVDRLSDLVAKFQAKKPERDTNGKFTSKKARVTAELQAYVASKRAA